MMPTKSGDSFAEETPVDLYLTNRWAFHQSFVVESTRSPQDINGILAGYDLLVCVTVNQRDTLAKESPTFRCIIDLFANSCTRDACDPSVSEKVSAFKVCFRVGGYLLQTSFSPDFPNKTIRQKTSVAMMSPKNKPHYLIVPLFNEVMRLSLWRVHWLLRLF